MIGNHAYIDTPLRCPGNDAADVAAALEEVGFQVTLKTNLTQGELETAIRQFGQTVRKGDVALFYFSGHRAQVRGVNYLIPVQMEAHDEDEIKYKAVAAEMVLDNLDRAGSSVNIVILDACRNNPFKRFRAVADGLASMSAPQGTLIAYATAPGSVARDGDGRNSPYTKHLVQSVKIPGLDVEKVFKRVRVGVLAETKNQQVPWESSSLVGEFLFAGSTRPVTPATPPGSSVRPAADSTIENSIGMKLKLIQPGEFRMGSTASEVAQMLQKFWYLKKQSFVDVQPQHRVRITKPFYLGVHEVTVGQFRKFVDDRGYRTEAETG